MSVECHEETLNLICELAGELFLGGPIKIGKRIASQLVREVFAIVATIIEDT